MPFVKETELPNGIKFHVYDGGDSDVNRLSVVMAGGKAEDSSARLFELINTVSAEGTKTHTAEEIADKLDFNGSWFTASVSVHHTVRNFFSLNSRFAEVLPLIAEITCSPSFNSRQVEVARERAAQSVELSREKVRYHSARLLDRMLFSADSPLASEPSPSAIREVTSDNLRRRYSEILHPANISVFLSGRIDSGLEYAVAEAFGAIPAAAKPIALNRVYMKPDGVPRTEWTERPGSLQSAIDAGIPLIGRSHPDYDMLRIAVVILGGYFGSRLMLNIREDKGYTYGIGASLLGYAGCSRLQITTETDNSHIAAVLEQIRVEMERMHDPASYTAEELQRASLFLKSTLAAQLDTPFAVMDYHQNHLLSDTPRGYFDSQQRAIEKMTPELLAEISRRYLRPENLYVAVAGAVHP